MSAENVGIYWGGGQNSSNAVQLFINYLIKDCWWKKICVKAPSWCSIPFSVRAVLLRLLGSEFLELFSMFRTVLGIFLLKSHMCHHSQDPSVLSPTKMAQSLRALVSQLASLFLTRNNIQEKDFWSDHTGIAEIRLAAAGKPQHSLNKM